MEKRRVVSVDITIAKYQDMIKEIIALSKKRKSCYICVANVHMLVEAYDNPGFKKVVNSAEIVTPDGMPLVWALRVLYGIEQDRVAGMDLLPALLECARRESLSVFFYGSTEGVLNKIRHKVLSHYVGARLAGTYSPPFRSLSPSEKEDVVQMINSSGANIVFVSLGCPKQEIWMNEMCGKINAVMIGVGAAFSTFSGDKRRAPVWMQRAGLEWLYRLLQEPKRLFWRYAYTNVKFILLMAREILKRYFRTDESEDRCE